MAYKTGFWGVQSSIGQITVITVTQDLYDFNAQERSFGTEISEREQGDLQDMIDDCATLHTLLTTAIDFKSQSEEWTNVKPLMSLNGDETLRVDGWYKAAYFVMKDISVGRASSRWDQFPIQIQVCNKLLDAIRAFKKYYPIIDCLCHPAIEPRHWYELFDEMNVDDPGDIQDILLSQLVQMGVMEHVDKLEEIAAGAQKEYSLRHAMSAPVWPCCISRADGGRSEACQTRVNSETSTSRF